MPSAPAPCSGPVLPSSFSGSLEVDGGPSPLPSVAGRTVALSYYVRENYTPLGGPSTYTCVQYHASNVTDGLGGFSLPAALPGSGCTRASCTFYTGPLAPINFSVAGSPPAGYFVTDSVSGPSVTLSFVYALASVALDPSGRTTLSTGAPTVIRATPQAGNGEPSPANVTYAWDLDGSGWNISAGAGSPDLTIEASEAAPGNLALWVNGTFNGTPEKAPEVELLLDAVATAATDGSVQPTSLDVGVPAEFVVVGSGSIGYSYDAVILVGVGTRSVEAPCVENGTDGGTEFVDCAASVTYGSSGVVQPSAELTNGFSSAEWTFPSLTVAPAPALGVTPSPLVAYVATNATVTVTVASSTGTAPLGPACFSTGNGRELCDRGPGPSYPFDIAWGSPGSYDAVATVADGAGANVSVSVPVEIYERMNATWVSSGGLNPGYLGEPYNLTAQVRGGALPLSYWWNTSGGATLMAGTLGSDGTLYYPYVPETLGWANVSLDLLDRLGTHQTVGFPALVVPGAPAELQMVEGAGSGTAMAGAPYEVEWAAIDGQGVVTPSYQSDELLTVSPVGAGPARTVWVNDSAGAVPIGPGGSFPVPLSAWSSGRLFLNISVGGNGTFYLTLSGPLPVVAGGSVPVLQVTANLHLLKLWDPTHVVGGARGGAALYRITDVFGDNLSGGYLVTRETFGSLTYSNLTSVRTGPGGSTVWVNFTALSASAGTVNVTFEEEDEPLLRVAVPAAPAPVPWLDVLAIVGVAAAAALGALLLARRRRPYDRGAPERAGEIPPATEEELRRLSEGRAHILAHADPEVGRTLDELSEGFPGRPPTPEEVTEWVASLVAEGTLSAELGEDGRSRFRRTAPPPPAPRVELDDRALEEALRRQRETETESEPEGSTGPPAAPEGGDR